MTDCQEYVRRFSLWSPTGAIWSLFYEKVQKAQETVAKLSGLSYIGTRRQTNGPRAFGLQHRRIGREDLLCALARH